MPDTAAVRPLEAEWTRLEPALGDLLEWEPPVPLDAGAVPLFPVDALPDTLATYVRAVKAFAEVPADLPGALSLAVVAAAVARKVRLEVRPGYSEPLNLFALVAMLPGTRKSAVFDDVTRPLVEYERALVARLGPAIAEAQSRARVREKELADAERLTARGGVDGPKWDTARRELARQIREAVVPADARVLMSDATPEAIGQGLAEQGGRLAVFSSEGDAFALTKRYSKDAAPNFEVFLKAHAGDDLRVDRRSAKPVTVERPALTLGLAVQPDVLRGLASDRTFRERGLLARFLFALPAETGARTFDGPAVPAVVASVYGELIRWLCEWGGQAEPLTLSPEAFTAWKAFALAVEQDRQPGGRYGGLLDWSGKLPGLVARLAGVLHLTRGAAAGHIGRTVDVETVQAAVKLGIYAGAHAVAAFNMMGADPTLEGAGRLLEWIRRKRLTVFTKREAHTATRAMFPKAADLDAPLRELAERGWIARVPTDQREGRPSERYTVSPYAHPYTP